MSKRKPLPYAAGWLLDDAMMSMASARRQIEPLLERGELEIVVRAAKALNEIHKAETSIKAIKTESSA